MNKEMTAAYHIRLAIMHINEAVAAGAKIEGRDGLIILLGDALSKSEPYTNHSGGAIGSDHEWGAQGLQYGVVSKHYWHGKQTPHGNTEITDDEFEEGKEHVLKANETLHRQPEKYMDLLARNYCQVKNAERIYAIGAMHKGIVDGGTGWAVQMAIDDGKTVYLFDQEREKWFCNENGVWAYCDTPTLTKQFAGIGTRKINEAGKKAIADVYRNTFGY